MHRKCRYLGVLPTDDASPAPAAPFVTDTVVVDRTDAAAPRIPARRPDERPALLANQRPQQVLDESEQDVDETEVRTPYQFHEPISDLLLRILLVVVLIVLAGFAGLIGAHFQRARESYTRGEIPIVGHYVDRLHDLLSFMGVVGLVGLMTLTMWSWLVVNNTTRVIRNLRSPWIASVSWLVAPVLGMAAHLTLDRRLDSGSLIGFVVFLAALYIPFGTIGAATTEVGGTPHLARVWFIASVIGAFLLIVGVAGSTRDLPLNNAEDSLRIRAFACYLAAIMLLAAAFLFYGAAQHLHVLVRHRWVREIDPDTADAPTKRGSMIRSARRARRWPVPTLFLRVIVVLLMIGSASASVYALFLLRGRGMQLDVGTDSARRAKLLDDYRRVGLQIAVVAVAARLLYVLWAIVAAVNARRRTIMAPPAIAIMAAFLLGPSVAFAGQRVGKEFGSALELVGGVMTIGGYIIGQLVLGRTVNSLGGRGQIFLGWMIVDSLGVGVAGFVGYYSKAVVQILGLGVLEMGLGVAAAALAWTAMSRLDRVTRADEPALFSRRRQAMGTPLPASGSAVLTSSHS